MRLKPQKIYKIQSLSVIAASLLLLQMLYWTEGASQNFPKSDYFKSTFP